MTSDDNDEPFTDCDHCGERFETGVRYPVVARETDEELELYSFCDGSCKQAWVSD